MRDIQKTAARETTNGTILAAILKNIIYGFAEALYPVILTLYFKGKSRLKNNRACMFVW